VESEPMFTINHLVLGKLRNFGALLVALHSRFGHREVGEAKKETEINKQQTLSVNMIRFTS
jgi:hypothetical protein